MTSSLGFVRNDGRTDAQPRPLVLTLDFVKYPEGSVLARAGDTVVLCNVSVEGKVPPFLRDTGSGWLTREYAMLPHQRAHHFADPTQCRPGHIRKVKYGQWAAEARQVLQAILHHGGLW